MPRYNPAKGSSIGNIFLSMNEANMIMPRNRKAAYVNVKRAGRTANASNRKIVQPVKSDIFCDQSEYKSLIIFIYHPAFAR